MGSIGARLSRVERSLGMAGPCRTCGGEGGPLKVLLLGDPPAWLATGATCLTCGRPTLIVRSPEDDEAAARESAPTARR